MQFLKHFMRSFHACICVGDTSSCYYKLKRLWKGFINIITINNGYLKNIVFFRTKVFSCEPIINDSRGEREFFEFI